MAIPATPSGYLLQQGNAQAYLSWDIAAGATSYDVQRSLDGVSYSSLATPTDNFYLDESVSAGVLYYYKVGSTNADGTSPYTTPQSCVPAKTGDLSLGQIRLMAQQRAEMVNSQFVTVPEWNTYINQSYFELYDMLVTVFEDYYLADPVTITLNNATGFYDLPDGTLYSGAEPFYKVRGVDLALNSSTNGWLSLRKFNFEDRNRFIYPNLTNNLAGCTPPMYRTMGSHIQFIPVPANGQTARLWYIPRVAMLLRDIDIMDGVSGWTEYVIVDAAIKALQKEESDVSVLMAQKQMLTDRIQSTAQNRDVGMPDTISDVRSANNGYGWGSGYSFGGGDGY